jgi:hypothetical protein
MADGSGVIVQVLAGGEVSRQLGADPPPSVLSGAVIVEHLRGDGGRLPAPEAGEVVLSVLSPEALTREPERVRDVVRHAPRAGGPVVIVVEAAEELREDELAVVLGAANRGHREVLVRVLADA